MEAAQNELMELPVGLAGLKFFNQLDVARNQLVMLPPDLAGCPRLTIVDISQNPITASAIPPGLMAATSLARLWRDGCPIDEAELSAMDGFAAFQEREAAREAKKLDQRRGETGGISFAGSEKGIAGQLASQENTYS